MMIFTDWETIKNILITGVITYLFLIMAIRMFGKRSLSQLNAYDFSVTVALGSILANTLTNASLSVMAGIASFTLLLLLQFIIAKIAVHIPFFNKVIKSSPSLLFYKGQFDEKMMKKKRVTKDDIFQAVRLEQNASLDEVLAVVMEVNGQLSVLQYSEGYLENSSLQNIVHPFLQKDDQVG